MRRWWPRLRAGWTGKINRNSSYPPSIPSSSAWGMWLPSSPAFYSNKDYSDCQGKGTFLLRHWRRRRWNSLVNLWRKNFRYSCKCILSLNILSLATCSEEECQTSEKHAVDGIFSNDTASPDIPRKCKCHRISGCSGRTKLKDVSNRKFVVSLTCLFHRGKPRWGGAALPLPIPHGVLDTSRLVSPILANWCAN